MAWAYDLHAFLLLAEDTETETGSGTSLGSSTTTAVGRALVSRVGALAGTSSTTAVGVSTVGSFGTSTTVGVGSALAAAAGTSAGTSTTLGISLGQSATPRRILRRPLRARETVADAYTITALDAIGRRETVDAPRTITPEEALV